MTCVTLERLGLAGMAIQALPVVEPAGKRGSVDVTITLAVRFVTVHTGHRSIEIAVAGEVSFLVCEYARAAVGEIDRVQQLRKLEREM
jgi:hypothetical protein